MRLYRYVDGRSRGWQTVQDDDYVPEAPWHLATRRETWQWRLTAERFSLLEVVLIEMIFAFLLGVLS